MNEKEFETLFKQYKKDIYRIAYTYVNNEADALVIVQESAYQAYISKDKIRDKNKFKSWILNITVNKSKDLLRKNKLISLEDLSNVNTMQAENKESVNIFMENLKALSMDEKNVIVFKVYVESIREKNSGRISFW
ncbi:sigma-70 family RNA polymerase sigma factor [Sedimentibacter sp. MB35-C1]|uniref:sigma-70 family RNA polymerase sigma factor n=1 Tax=Sedimentibacter sp. MB35-C1 TaxID=3070995 RepID=UPI0027DF39C3|nr:sigma-70 family RNA polymerase sigma factor [Sedimentibacter sp. MB35-C1]WMJ79017.1 sigma-70 family RNA polymerase sigma factor [Sedimentibacter sp. MB35-C1]